MATPSSQLIAELGLESHPEGGYYKLTDLQESQIASPFADEKPRPMSTSIFYLLSHDRPRGVIHMNKSVTYHVLHQGRAKYTLIHPTSPPKIEHHIMGPNEAAGETRMLLVGTGVWKMSELPQEDLDAAESAPESERQEARDKVNCLITEVVVPGFDWDDHKYLTREGLERLFEGDKEKIRLFERDLKEA
ncbi:hypothetical protein NMY22_g18987 [Coprinellus aureogranulatus]|nr:hypothetical protein NMY22_g18987 [Coprinellus aureogranulatus]